MWEIVEDILHHNDFFRLTVSFYVAAKLHFPSQMTFRGLQQRDIWSKKYL